MVTITLNPAAAGINMDALQQPQGPAQPARNAAPGGQVVPGLNGRNVGVGDGALRGAALQLARQAKSFFSALAQPFKEKASSVKTYFAGNAQLRQSEINTRQALSLPMQGSVLDVNGVRQKLFEHAQSMGSKLAPAEITALVAAGERIAKAIQQPDNAGGSPLTLDVNGNALQVHSNAYTARALSWFMMAQGALQDVKNAQHQQGDAAPSSMPTNGAFIMKDPGNRIHNFLMAAPTCCGRISSHVNERSASPAGWTGKPVQHGIEDFSNKMPGKGGTMLFDRLKDGKDGVGELFVKFENVGCPRVLAFKLNTDRHEGVGVGLARLAFSIRRNFKHAFSFLGSRGSDGNAAPGVRQEHVYKGLLRDTVYTPVKQLVQQAEDLGLNFGNLQVLMDASKQMHKNGMAAVNDILENLEQLAKLQFTPGNKKVLETLALKPGPTKQQATLEKLHETGLAPAPQPISAEQIQRQRNDFMAQLALVKAQVQQEMFKLGLQSSHYGIERRGAEVHISLTGQEDPI